MAVAASKPCLCSLESTIDDYVVIQDCAVTTVRPASEEEASNTQGGNSSPRLRLRGALMHTHNFFLRVATCCVAKGWNNFPNNDDPEHSLPANSIFLELRQKIQENRLSLSPPVTKLDLKGYKFESTASDTMYSQYYYLRIQAGENFFLYVKVGLTSENYARVNLLRLSSKEDRVLP